MRSWSQPRLFIQVIGNIGDIRLPAMKQRARLYAGYLLDQMGLSGQKFRFQTFHEDDGTLITVHCHRGVLGEIVQARVILSGQVIPPKIIDPLGGFIIDPKDGSGSWQDIFINTVGYLPEEFGAVYKTPSLLAAPEFELATVRAAGPISWHGSVDGKEAVITWDHGLPSRYRLSASSDYECGGRHIGSVGGNPIFAQSGEQDIYLDGRRIQTPYGVVGAAATGNTLIYVAYVDLGFVPNPGDSTNEKAIATGNANAKTATFFYSRNKGSTWTVVGTVTTTQYFKAPWFFSPDGLNAATVVEYGALQCDVYEVTISEDGAGVLSLTSAIESRAYPYPQGTFTSYTEYEDNSGNDQGPNGDLALYEYDPWQAWHPGTTEFAGEIGPLSSLYAKIYAYAEYGGTPKDYRFTDVLAPRIAAVEAASASPAYGGWYPCTGVSSAGTPVVDGDPHVFNNFIVEHTSWYVRWKAVRSVAAEKAHNRDVVEYAVDVDLSRLAAVDYDTAGTKLYVEQAFDAGDSYYKAEAYTYDRWTNTAQPWGLNIITATITELKEHYKLDMKWDVLINDVPLISCRGGIDSGGTYTQTTKERNGYNDGVPYTNYASESDDGTPFTTERIHLLDLDARTKSAIFTKATVTGEFRGLSHLPRNSALLDYQGIAITASGVRTDKMVFMHNGIVEQELDVEAGSSAGLPQLYNAGAALFMMPMLFSYEEEFENVVPSLVSWTNALGSWDQYRRWDTTSGGDECWPTYRSKGSLTVRDPDQVCASFSDKTVVGNTSAPCSRTPRDLNWINTLIVNGTTFDIAALLSTAIVGGGGSTPDAQFNLPPIRAV